MVAPVALLVERRSTEFPAPDDQRILEQSALFQVGQQTCDRLVGRLTPFAVISLNVLVRVPTAAGTAVEFHETDPAFHQTTGHQTVATVDGRERVVQAVELFRGFRFFRKIHGFGGGGLHLVGHFV